MDNNHIHHKDQINNLMDNRINSLVTNNNIQIKDNNLTLPLCKINNLTLLLCKINNNHILKIKHKTHNNINKTTNRLLNSLAIHQCHLHNQISKYHPHNLNNKLINYHLHNHINSRQIKSHHHIQINQTNLLHILTKILLLHINRIRYHLHSNINNSQIHNIIHSNKV
jgi:hypothetical protein